jgi:hypothetical protein
MTGSGPDAYERHLVAAIFAPWANVLLSDAALTPGEHALDAFLRAQFAASPIAAEIASLDEAAWRALVDDIERRLMAYTDDDGFAIPFEAHSVVA